MGETGPEDPSAAHAELQSILEKARLAKRLSKNQLVQRARLGRTSVSNAFNSVDHVPSPETVDALAKALGLDPGPLLALQATAKGPASTGVRGVGRPIAEWSPHDLDVHPAAVPPPRPSVVGTEALREELALPGYVRRAHDDVLDAPVQAAAQGDSRMAVLVGSSSTGKTRACWEAVQPLAALGWRLWHPDDSTHATAVLEELERVGPRTVVWLNEAQRYLGASGGGGKRFAAALRSLLTDRERAPVLVLGTLWNDYLRDYTAVPSPGGPDPYAQVRELLAGRLVTVPEDFGEEATAAARSLADQGDGQLAHALEHAKGGRLAQFLAGAPELVHRYRNASSGARALLDAAMDARRLGVRLYLPAAFLAHAAEDYLNDEESDDLDDNWVERAFTETSKPVHGKYAPLRRVRRPCRALNERDTTAPAGQVYRLADYLEQLGRHERHTCPPVSFWKAALDHLDNPEDQHWLAESADESYGLDNWGDQLLRRSAAAGHTGSLSVLAIGREDAGDKGQAEELAQQAADAGDPVGLISLAAMRVLAEDRVGAEKLARRVADAGHARHLRRQAEMWEEVDTWAWAARLFRQVADSEHCSGAERPNN